MVPVSKPDLTNEIYIVNQARRARRLFVSVGAAARNLPTSSLGKTVIQSSKLNFIKHALMVVHRREGVPFNVSGTSSHLATAVIPNC